METRALAAIAAVESRAEQRKILEAWSRLETGDYTSANLRATLSLFNIHVGSGAGDWDHAAPRGFDGGAGNSPLRGYTSLEQSVRDVLLLLHRVPSLYGAALEYYEAGQAEKFFEAVTRGDGSQGYVGPANAVKANNYIAGLNRRFADLA